VDDRRSSSLTQAGTLLGTPHYMAPELWRAESATRRSDVYALGVLLYILCSGRPPTEATSPVELATRVQEQEPRPLLERAPRVRPAAGGDHRSLPAARPLRALRVGRGPAGSALER
jgi:serine/threonine protein kinase